MKEMGTIGISLRYRGRGVGGVVWGGMRGRRKMMVRKVIDG